MNDRLRELKKDMSELVDEELLRIVETDYADYRQDALDCAKQELMARGIQFNEPTNGAESLESEQEENTFHPELVTVATFSIPYEAQLARGLLESNSIEAFVADEQMIGINWLYSNALGGVRLQVTENNAEQAMQLLDSEVEPANVDSQPEDGWEVCGNCGSRNVEYFTAKKGATLLSLFLLGLPLFLPSKKLRCLDCARVWDYQDRKGEAGLIVLALFGWMLLIVAVMALAGLFPNLFGDNSPDFPPFR